MRIILEFILLIGIIFPLYHMVNVVIFLIKNKRKKSVLNKDRPISILIPCYNESLIIKHTIQGLRRIDYNNFECIIINDGSTDDTMLKLKKTLKLKKIKKERNHDLKTTKVKYIFQSRIYQNFYVIDKKNGGKSSALNAGINFSHYSYVATLDADSVLKKDALAIASAAFNDERVVAVSGAIQILQSFNLSENDYKTTLDINPLLRLQTLEYMKSCFCYKVSLATIQSLLVISGAFGVFKKDILLAINGFRDVIGEDLDLTLRIQFMIMGKKDKIIVYEPQAICYTEGPENFKNYLRQRKRWQQSFIGGLIDYHKYIFKNVFTKSLCFFMVLDALILGVVSSFVIISFFIFIINNLLINNWSNVLIYIIIFISVNLIYNVTGILVAHHYNIKYNKIDVLRLFNTIIHDILIYRIIIVFTILYGTISYFLNKRRWDKVDRSGRNYDVLKKSRSEKNG